MRLLLGGGAATVAGLLGLRRCAMTENKPMRAFESFFPEPLHVDEVGWERFLNQWNSEALELIKQKLLALGIGLGPNVNESLRKKLESHHVFLPSEIFLGGLSYPVQSDASLSEVERRLQLLIDCVAIFCETRGGPGFLDRIFPSLSGLLRFRLPVEWTADRSTRYRGFCRQAMNGVDVRCRT